MAVSLKEGFMHVLRLKPWTFAQAPDSPPARYSVWAWETQFTPEQVVDLSDFHWIFNPHQFEYWNQMSVFVPKISLLVVLISSTPRLRHGTILCSVFHYGHPAVEDWILKQLQFHKRLQFDKWLQFDNQLHIDSEYNLLFSQICCRAKRILTTDGETTAANFPWYLFPISNHSTF